MFIKRVRFFLHPDYRPNDVIDITQPPFHLTRYGWGEFPVRIRIFFVDPRNKPVDIVHSLKVASIQVK
jgi:transcription initiation factor IIF auxiliary subunit